MKFDSPGISPRYGRAAGARRGARAMHSSARSPYIARRRRDISAGAMLLQLLTLLLPQLAAATAVTAARVPVDSSATNSAANSSSVAATPPMGWNCTLAHPTLIPCKQQLLRSESSQAHGSYTYAGAHYVSSADVSRVSCDISYSQPGITITAQSTRLSCATFRGYTQRRASLPQDMSTLISMTAGRLNFAT